MFIDLSWTDLNSAGTTLKIYRGDTALDTSNLPANPIVTLTNGETSYRDETNVALGQTYFYVFVTSTAEDTVTSPNYKVTAVTRRGPGPQTLKQGNNTLGYFGVIQSGEFINASDLVAKTGLAAIATGLSIINPFPTWHKFVRNNKVLIVPEGPLASTVNWQQLYSAGMVFGTDDSGPTGLVPTPLVTQNKKVTIGSDTYRIRILKGMIDVPYTAYQTVVNSPTEFSDLIYPMAHPVPPDQRLENLYLNGQPLYTLIGQNGATNYIQVQELASATLCNYRGQSTSSADTTSDTTPNLVIRNTVAITTTSTSYAWLPVLELIEG